MSQVYLHGGMILTLDGERRVYHPGTVVFEGSTIRYVGDAAGAPPPGPDDILQDCTSLLVMPGLINAHTHTGMTYFRGLLEDLPSVDWFRHELDAERYLTPEDVYWSGLLGAYELLRQGVTATADRFSNMDRVTDALVHAGLRAVVAPSLVDRGADQRKRSALDLLERYGVADDGLIQVGLGPVGPDTCSTELLQWTRQQADRWGALIFIHVAQSRQELAEIARRGYQGSVRYLDAIGFLGGDVVAAHCIYVDEEEIALLEKHGVRVAHCPASNAKIEGRIAPVLQMRHEHVAVGLGTDCAASNNSMDLFSEMKTAGLLHKIAAEDPQAMPVDQLLDLATRDSAALLNLADRIGSLEVGKRADVITVQRNQPHLQPWHDPVAGLVYATRGLDVRDVWVDGQQRVRDGQLIASDFDEAIERAVQWVQRHAGPLAARREQEKTP
ncbi:MAG: amidohydrolase [Chloroflexi bacterium]|nr:amidohydrolase [Chloroflexota bacterium]